MPFDADLLLRELLKHPPKASSGGPPIEPFPARDRTNAPTASVRTNRLAGAIAHPDRAEWLALWRKSPQLIPPPKPCGWCRSSVFWKSIHGVYVCSNCHPPAYPALAEMWLQLVATDDGPQLVRLQVAPRQS
jgi:hypothetical protein